MLQLTIDDNPIEIKQFEFSGGERQVRLLDYPQTAKRIHILAHLWSSNDILDLMLTADALFRVYGHEPYMKITCPYLPYARQDRVCSPGEASSLDVMCGLFDSVGLHELEVWDVHNLNATKWSFSPLVKFINKPAADFVEKIPQAKDCVLVSPDKGAFPRAVECAMRLETSMICAEKTRHPDTGYLAAPSIPVEHVASLPQNPDFLIVDDICDGGRTFINLVKVLRPLTKGKIYLYVTHGIFSQGFEPLAPHFDHIYVANVHPFVTLSGMEYLITHILSEN